VKVDTNNWACELQS